MAGEELNFTANLDTNRRRVIVFVCGAVDYAQTQISELMASIGLPFPDSDLMFTQGVVSGNLGPFTSSADEGCWRLEADF